MAGKLPYDSMADSLKTIATGVGAEVPTKKYSNKKDEIAGVLSAISDAGIGSGGGAGWVVFTADNTNLSNANFTMDRTAEQLRNDAKAGNVIGAMIISPEYGSTTNFDRKYMLLASVNDMDNAVTFLEHTYYFSEYEDYAILHRVILSVSGNGNISFLDERTNVAEKTE